jgi:hypothetical protein
MGLRTTQVQEWTHTVTFPGETRKEVALGIKYRLLIEKGGEVKRKEERR